MDLGKLMNKSFLTRTASGIVLVAVLLAAGIVGGDLLYAFTFIISLVGVSEMLNVVGLRKSLIGGFAYLGTIIYFILIRLTQAEHIEVFIIGYLMMILAVYVFSYPKYKTEEVMISIFSVIYVAVMMSFIYLTRTYNDDGIVNIWLIFLCSWGCDTCAYLAGVTCGKHKMAPILSPKKSVEGAIGGVIGAIMLGTLYGFIMRYKVDYFDNPALVYGFLCGVGGLISMVGDLAASAIKRNYDIKDYGKLIPGHGGILDRFDSVLFTGPVIYFLIVFLA